MKEYLFVFVSLILTCSTFAQHENCSHGDAPSVDPVSNGKYIHLSDEVIEAIGLKLADVKIKKFEEIVEAIGRIENIPERVNTITSRVSGRAVEVYVTKDAFVKKGIPICKIESFLAGNPPPSVILKSRENGIVETLDIFKDSGVEAGREFARIVDTSELYAVANVFESALKSLKIGDKARVRIEALGEERVVEGVLVKFGSSLNVETNTLPVYFLIKNSSGKIKNGMRAVFSVIVRESPSMTIPLESLSEENGLNYVYVQSLTQKDVLERRFIVSHKRNDIEAEVEKGLSSGEKIAVKGLYQLKFLPRDNDPHNHSHSHVEKQHEASKEKNHLGENKERKCDDISHNHDEHSSENVELHNHLNEHSFWSEYKENLLVALLIVSLILNFAFAVSRGISREKKK